MSDYYFQRITDNNYDEPLLCNALISGTGFHLPIASWCLYPFHQKTTINFSHAL